jgi:DNA recombination-mediator protein A
MDETQLSAETLAPLDDSERYYPALLRRSAAAPPVITVRGNVASLRRSKIAIVGARNASAAGACLHGAACPRNCESRACHRLALGGLKPCAVVDNLFLQFQRFGLLNCAKMIKCGWPKPTPKLGWRLGFAPLRGEVAGSLASLTAKWCMARRHIPQRRKQSWVGQRTN